MTPTVPHLLCIDNDKDIHLHSITRRFLGVKETVKDYVPVDSESVTHNMWVLLERGHDIFQEFEAAYEFAGAAFMRQSMSWRVCA